MVAAPVRAHRALYTESFASILARRAGAVLAAFAATAEAALREGPGNNAGHDLNRDNLTAFPARRARRAGGLSSAMR